MNFSSSKYLYIGIKVDHISIALSCDLLCNSFSRFDFMVNFFTISIHCTAQEVAVVTDFKYFGLWINVHHFN